MVSRGDGKGRLALDATPLRRQGKGASRFLGDVLSEMARRPPELPVDVCVTAGADLPSLPQAPGLSYHAVPARPAIVWEQLALPLWVRARRPRALLTLRERLSPRLDCGFILYLFESPDRRLEAERKGWYGRGAAAYTRRCFPATLSRAAAVLSSSAWSRGELERRYGAGAGGEVIPPGICRLFSPLEGREAAERVRDRYSDGRPFVFMIGSADPREETGAALGAFSALARRDPSPLLLIAGRVPEMQRRALRAAADASGCAGRVRFVGYRPDPELRDLYGAAEVYLQATRFEGFGLQVAEALACGVPVVAAAAGALPEVAGDAAVLVPPGDGRALSEGLLTLWAAPWQRSALRRRGLARARAFSWDEAWPRLLSRWIDAAGRGEQRGGDRCSS